VFSLEKTRRSPECNSVRTTFAGRAGRRARPALRPTARCGSNIAPSEHLGLRERVMHVEAEGLIELVGRQGKLTATMAAHQRALLTSNVDTFDDRKREFLALAQTLPVVVPMGQTKPPADDATGSTRPAVICRAAADFDAKAVELAKVTNRVEWINMVLHEEGLSILTAEERTCHARNSHA